MLKQFMFFIFGAVLLLQNATAMPHMRRETVAIAQQQSHNTVDRSTSSSEESNDPRVKLVVVTLSEMLVLAKYTIESGRPLFKSVLKELDALPTRSEELQANMTRMSTFLKNTENIEISEKPESALKLFEQMIYFSEVMEDLDLMPPELELTKTLRKAFDDSGVEKVENDFEEELLKLLNSFGKAIETYLGTLTEEQKIRNKKLVEWYQNYKNETDNDKKLLLFGEFFEIND